MTALVILMRFCAALHGTPSAAISTAPPRPMPPRRRVVGQAVRLFDRKMQFAAPQKRGGEIYTLRGTGGGTVKRKTRDCPREAE